MKDNDIAITAKNFSLSTPLSKYIRSRLEGLWKLSCPPERVEVVLESNVGHASENVCTINIFSKLPHIKISKSHFDMYVAINTAAHTIVEEYRESFDKHYGQ